MTTVLTDNTHYSDIADAIREKMGVSTQYLPSEMAAAIEGIETGINLTSADEGKVVVESDGAYVLQAQTSLNISQNDTYDTTTNNEVVVSVSGGSSATLVSKTITENGTYDPADDQADGYSGVTVNVSGGGEAEPILPAEYQEVEYVEFDGNSYVPISGRIIAVLSSYECWAERTTESTSEMAALGTSAANNARLELYFKNGTATSYAANVDGSIVSANGVNALTGGSVSAQNVGVNQKAHLIVAITNQTTTSSFGTNYIVIGRHNTSYRFTGKVYKVRIGTVSYYFTSGDTPAAGITISTLTWLKPCYRKSDDVVGFYDTEADVFYTNSGSGTLTAGPDV